MVVKGTMNVEVNISLEEAVRVLRSAFGFSEDDMYTKLEIRDDVLYKVHDNSWYRAYSDDVDVVSSNKEVVEVFKAISLLEKAVKEKQKNGR